MPIYKLKLINKYSVARDTLQFDFEKPDGFQFIPGQYGGFTLMDIAGLEPTQINRRFSILSTPHDPHLSIATRAQQSAYKQALNSLTPGSEIKFAGPIGQFVLTDESAPVVMIAGGIGITPFYSMLRHALPASDRLFYLFYGNQTREDAAYLEELQALSQQYPHFKLIAALANPDQDWAHETGFITDSLIKKHISDIQQPIYYVCGSPAMVKALQETLQDLGIAQDRIKVEDFPGY